MIGVSFPRLRLRRDRSRASPESSVQRTSRARRRCRLAVAIQVAGGDAFGVIDVRELLAGEGVQGEFFGMRQAPRNQRRRERQGTKRSARTENMVRLLEQWRTRPLSYLTAGKVLFGGPRLSTRSSRLTGRRAGRPEAAKRPSQTIGPQRVAATLQVDRPVVGAGHITGKFEEFKLAGQIEPKPAAKYGFSRLF